MLISVIIVAKILRAVHVFSFFRQWLRNLSNSYVLEFTFWGCHLRQAFTASQESFTIRQKASSASQTSSTPGQKDSAAWPKASAISQEASIFSQKSFTNGQEAFTARKVLLLPIRRLLWYCLAKDFFLYCRSVI